MSKMTKEQAEHFGKILSAFLKKSRQLQPIKKNQLSLWLGRLIIAYNSLENQLAIFLMLELVEMIAGDESSAHRAWNGNLNEIVMGAISFKQKLDFLISLLLKRFSKNPEQQKLINKIAGLMSAADEFRNQMVHSVWHVSHSEFSRVKPKTKGHKGLRTETVKEDVRQIDLACDAILFLEGAGLFFMAGKMTPEKSDLDFLEQIGKAFQPMVKPQR
jgi:hypothetical protein